jgi:hypothetical protein
MELTIFGMDRSPGAQTLICLLGDAIFTVLNRQNKLRLNLLVQKHHPNSNVDIFAEQDKYEVLPLISHLGYLNSEAQITCHQITGTQSSRGGCGLLQFA